MTKLKTVLLIDDSNATNNLNRSILAEMGVAETIRTSSSGEAAIEFIKNYKDNEFLPDLILLDLKMPEMDGFEFMERYINIEEVMDSDYKPIIAIVSDYLDFENFSKSKLYKSYGVVEHIKKPMDKEDIAELIEEHFEQEA